MPPGRPAAAHLAQCPPCLLLARGGGEGLAQALAQVQEAASCPAALPLWPPCSLPWPSPWHRALQRACCPQAASRGARRLLCPLPLRGAMGRRPLLQSCLWEAPTLLLSPTACPGGTWRQSRAGEALLLSLFAQFVFLSALSLFLSVDRTMCKWESAWAGEKGSGCPDKIDLAAASPHPQQASAPSCSKGAPAQTESARSSKAAFTSSCTPLK